MDDRWRVLGFGGVMAVMMPLYQIGGLESLSATRQLASAAPAAMAAYLGVVAFTRPTEAWLRDFWYTGIAVLALIALFSAGLGMTWEYRGATFGLHSMTWGGLALWWVLRRDATASFTALIGVALGAQTFNTAEFGLCNFVAPEPAGSGSTSVCARMVNSPLYMAAPMVVATAAILLGLRAWRR